MRGFIAGAALLAACLFFLDYEITRQAIELCSKTAPTEYCTKTLGR